MKNFHLRYFSSEAQRPKGDPWAWRGTRSLKNVMHPKFEEIWIFLGIFIFNIGAAGLNIQNYTRNFELKFLGGLEFCSRSGLPLKDKEMC